MSNKIGKKTINKQKRLERFRTEHLLIFGQCSSGTFYVFGIPEKYLHLREDELFIPERMEEIVKWKNGTIKMYPNDYLFYVYDIESYYNEAIHGFFERAKECGYNIYLGFD